MHTPFNWIRVQSTNVQGGAMRIQFDVHDASATHDDRWMAFGDEVNYGVFDSRIMLNGTDGTFAQRLLSLDPMHSREPVVYNAPGNYSDFVTARAPPDLLGYLDLVHPTFVSLMIGLQVATVVGRCDATCVGEYDDQLLQMASEIESRGAVPIFAHLAWHPDPAVRSTIMMMNSGIDAAIAADSHIVAGPDLWTLFEQHPEYWDSVGGGGVSPNTRFSEMGVVTAQTAWANSARQPGGVYCSH
jgi:hypothetical protein